MSPKQLLIILIRRAWIIAIVFASVTAAAGALLYMVPPRYDAQATATIDPASSDPVTGQSVGATGLRLLQGNLVALARSQKVAVEVVRRLGLTSNPQLMAQYRRSDSVGRVDASEWIAAELLRGLEAKFNEGTNVFVIVYRSSNPLLASQVANVFMAAFTDAAIEAKVAGAQQTAQWFEPQMQRLQAEADEARQKVNRFQTTQRLAPSSHADPDMAVLQQVTTELSGARAELLKVREAINLINQGKAEGLLESFDTPLLQSLKSSLAQITSEIGRMQAAVGANNPKLAALTATRQSIEAQIAAERLEVRKNIENKRKTLEAQIASIEKARGDQLAVVIGIQEQRDQLAVLQRDWEFKQDRYMQASKAASAARMQGQLSFSNIATLDKAATPVTPSFPKPLLVIPAAIAAGLGLGTILALIAEALDRRIRTSRDLEFAVAAPQLGMMVSTPVSRRARYRQQKAMRALAPREAAG